MNGLNFDEMLSNVKHTIDENESQLKSKWFGFTKNDNIKEYSVHGWFDGQPDIINFNYFYELEDYLKQHGNNQEFPITLWVNNIEFQFKHLLGF